jgi:hypothetical protein
MLPDAIGGHGDENAEGGDRVVRVAVFSTKPYEREFLSSRGALVDAGASIGALKSGRLPYAAEASAQPGPARPDGGSS